MAMVHQPRKKASTEPGPLKSKSWPYPDAVVWVPDAKHPHRELMKHNGKSSNAILHVHIAHEETELSMTPAESRSGSSSLQVEIGQERSRNASIETTVSQISNTSKGLLNSMGGQFDTSPKSPSTS